MSRRSRGSLPASGVGKVQGGNRHGLSLGQIEAMRARQRGCCAVCGAELGLVPVVDHDHALARLHGHPERRGCSRCVRALLCRDCNLMLGHAKDSPETLEAAAGYLRLTRALRS